MEKALLVTVRFKHDRSAWAMEDLALELEELVRSSGVEALDNIPCLCEKPTANLLIGQGKVEEIALLAAELEVDAVIFSEDLSGTQQRNLEEAIGKKTIDRTQLILEIFAHRAKSPEGKMQVELAQLEYLLPRLIGAGLILSRTGGGIGTSGPGEQQLEVDRRRIRKRIDKMRQDLKKMEAHRKTIRKKRKDSALPSVTLIGYTNAGKSTLLNALTNAGQVTSDGLFTTLDPLYKSLQLTSGEQIVISDTVGFLHNLPHHLIEAFKATLEEAMDADLLLHVLDASNPRARDYYKAVLEVLSELGAADKSAITVLNKIDLLTDRAQAEQLAVDLAPAVTISAKSKENINQLLEKIAQRFAGRMERLELLLPHTKMGLVDLFYRQGKVEEVKYLDKGIRVKVNLPKTIANKVLSDKAVEKLT